MKFQMPNVKFQCFLGVQRAWSSEARLGSANSRHRGPRLPWKSKGQAALPAIILVSAIVLTIGLAIASLALSEHNVAFLSRLSGQAFDLAETCAEDASGRLAHDPNYIGNYSLQISGNQCNINIETLGNQRKITVSASVKQVFRNIETYFEVLASGQLQPISWKEV